MLLQVAEYFLVQHIGQTPCVCQGSICTELLQRLGDQVPSLARAVALAAEADCLVALAQTARDSRYCRPTLTRDNVLRIKQGLRASAHSLTSKEELVPHSQDYRQNR